MKAPCQTIPDFPVHSLIGPEIFPVRGRREFSRNTLLSLRYSAPFGCSQQATATPYEACLEYGLSITSTEACSRGHARLWRPGAAYPTQQVSSNMLHGPTVSTLPYYISRDRAAPCRLLWADYADPRVRAANDELMAALKKKSRCPVRATGNSWEEKRAAPLP